MKKLINIIIIMATLLASTASFANDDDEEISYRGQMLKRMQARKVQSRTRAVLLETYYGEKIEANQVEGAGRDGSISRVLREREVRLNNGRTFRSEEIEYVYETSENERAPHERVKGDNERAPHERSTERKPQEDEE